MSEPIELYDINANLVIMSAPTTAAIMVERGELFELPPTVVESPPVKPKTRSRVAKSKE